MGASSAHAAGTTVEAGLPNITGTFVASAFTDSGIEATGAFYAASLSKTKTSTSYSTFQEKGLGFDASILNSIYGRSSTVQPPAYYMNIWLRTA